MDIDAIAKQVQELTAWKAKVEPMLEVQMAHYEKWKANQQKDGTEEVAETEDEERARICREADAIRAEEAAQAGGAPVVEQETPTPADPNAPPQPTSPNPPAG